MNLSASMARLFAVWCLAGGLIGCDDDSARVDAGSDVFLDDATDDSSILGDADLLEDGSIVAKCGDQGECGPDQFCVYPSCHHCISTQSTAILPCPAPYCASVATTTCKTCGGCFEDDPCKLWGECLKILDKKVICGCPRDPLKQ